MIILVIIVADQDLSIPRQAADQLDGPFKVDEVDYDDPSSVYYHYQGEKAVVACRETLALPGRRVDDLTQSVN